MGNADTVMSACARVVKLGESLHEVQHTQHTPQCPHASAQSPCNSCGTNDRLGVPAEVAVSIHKLLAERQGEGGIPDRMTTCSMSLFFTSANSHEYCRTASAVPWNHSVPPVPGVCDAASTCGEETLRHNKHFGAPRRPVRTRLHKAVATETNTSPKIVRPRHVAVQGRGVELQGRRYQSSGLQPTRGRDTAAGRLAPRRNLPV